MSIYLEEYIQQYSWLWENGGAYFDTNCGGGGGGSSYTNSTLCSNVTHTQGYQDGAGYITITEIG